MPTSTNGRVVTEGSLHETVPSVNGHSAEAELPVLQEAAVLDGMGRASSNLLVAVAEQVRSLGVGEVLKVVTDDPSARGELNAWCRMTGHKLVGVIKGRGYASLYVRRTT
jgi:tRNA 2-thiouridine synthesizing protein A